jgi:hypothetical protein
LRSLFSLSRLRGRVGPANNALRILNLSPPGLTGGPCTPRLHGSIATVSGIPGRPAEVIPDYSITSPGATEHILTGTQETRIASRGALAHFSHGLLIERDSGLIANPLTGIARRAAETMRKVGTEFGLSPASRTRIAVNPDGPKGKFDGLLG